MNSHRHFSHLVGALALAGLAVVATACGGSSPSSSSTSTPPATSPPAASSPATSGTTPPGGAAAIAAITTNWETFFNAKTPESQRVALLQDGDQFTSVIKAQQGTGLA